MLGEDQVVSFEGGVAHYRASTSILQQFVDERPFIYGCRGHGQQQTRSAIESEDYLQQVQALLRGP